MFGFLALNRRGDSNGASVSSGAKNCFVLEP
jgi:hypothetical protein